MMSKKNEVKRVWLAIVITSQMAQAFNRAVLEGYEGDLSEFLDEAVKAYVEAKKR